MTTNGHGYDLDDYDLTRLASERLIAQHKKPEPKPPPEPKLRSKLDTHIHPERKQLEDFVSRQITTALTKAFEEYHHEILTDLLGCLVAHLKDEFEDKLDIIKSKHASDIAALQDEIRELKAKSKRGPRGPRGAKGDKGSAPAFHSWSIDAERFRVTGFFNDGTSTPYLELWPLFENYFNQTSGHNGLQ